MAEMAEVIAFLIEHYQDFDDCPPPDDLGQILEDVGFDDVQINNALMLLAVLSDNEDATKAPRIKISRASSGATLP